MAKYLEYTTFIFCHVCVPESQPFTQTLYLLVTALKMLGTDHQSVLILTLTSDAYLFLVITTRCYASAILATGLCPSVCHKSVFYRNG